MQLDVSRWTFEGHLLEDVFGDLRKHSAVPAPSKLSFWERFNRWLNESPFARNPTPCPPHKDETIPEKPLAVSILQFADLPLDPAYWRSRPGWHPPILGGGHD
jgi:hypothetical protein